MVMNRENGIFSHRMFWNGLLASDRRSGDERQRSGLALSGQLNLLKAPQFQRRLLLN